ncbi:MAG: GNAT family N-acetyltransferase [Candidatus Limnocylindrales bacterium]
MFGLRLLWDPHFQSRAIATLAVVAVAYRAIQFAQLSAQPQFGYDLSFYWSAARHLLTGQPPYDAAQLSGTYVPQGGGFYLYPPLLAVLFIPLAAIFPDGSGQVAWLWSAFGAAILLATVVWLASAERIARDRRGLLLLLAAVFAFPPVVGELVLGNVHLELLGLFALAWYGVRRGDRRGEAIAGLAIALAGLIKVLPFLLLVWFVATRRWRAVAWTIGGAMVIAAATVPITGLQPWLDFPTVLANHGAPADPTDALAPAVWIGALTGPLVARLIVVSLGVVAVIWAARRLTVPASYAVAVATATLIAPSVFQHYLAMLVLPLLLALAHSRRRGWVAVAYFAMWGGQQPALGAVGWLLNRALPAAGALLVPAGLLVWGGRSMPRDPVTRLRPQRPRKPGAILEVPMPTTQTQPAPSATDPECPLVARSVAFDAIDRATWHRLFAASARATSFSRWNVHRAWWDAYGGTAHEQYLLVVDRADPESVRGIVPLMHRHEVEPEDAATATMLRHPTYAATAVEPGAKAVFFGASYHTDYATILAAPDDLADVAIALVDELAVGPDRSHGDRDWDVVDLRRLRDDDPVTPALQQAFEARAAREGWRVTREQEDVCPVVTMPADGDWEAYLDTLDKKARHEIRRKIRRAETGGDNVFELVEPTPAAIVEFIALHQARWGAEGLFPDTAGGARSRHFVHRLAELELAEGASRTLQLGRFRVAGRTIFLGVAFDDDREFLFYNAGVDPAARDLSPGVTGTAAYLRERQAAGCRRFDFLRGDEAYKYEWGAVDEPIHRLLVERMS